MLEVVCCDEKRTSKHCPECGKKLEHPLSALHRHLDGVVKIDVAKLVAVKKDTQFKNQNVVLYQRRVARVEKTVTKWTTWRDAIGDAIKKDGGSIDPPEPKEPETDKGSHKKSEAKPEKTK